MSVSAAALALFLASTFGARSALACSAPEAEVARLLDAREFEAALELATRRKAEAPDARRSYWNLAHVWMRWATGERAEIDTAALGIPPEGGRATLTSLEQLERAIKSRVALDPERSRAAVEILRAMLARWPKELDAHLCLCEVLRVRGDRDDFLTALRAAARAFAGDREKIVPEGLRLARGYVEEDDLEGAVQTYRALLETFPDSPELLSSLGAVRIRQGELAEPLALFERAHALAPRDSLVLGNLAHARVYARRFGEAEETFRLLITQRPEETQILFDLAVLALARDPRESIAAWDRYLEAASKRPDDRGTVAAARQIRASLPDGASDEWLFDLARSFLDAGANEWAMPLLDTLAGRAPGEAAVPFLLARAYEQEGFLALARDELRKSEALVSGSKVIRPLAVAFESGRLAYALGAYEESVGYLERVERKSPDHPNLQYLLGEAHHALGHGQRARDYFRACAERPNNRAMSDWCRGRLDASVLRE
jgi:tetratricopeptide (TPR) repeat protein